jgi:hypothetical protein
MGITVYSESTIMYRPVQKYEQSQFRHFHHIRRIKKRRNNCRKMLFSSNFRPLIMMANGIKTDVEKGSKSENMFWTVKDSLYCPGNRYYFDTPEEAERVFRISYPKYLKDNWYEKSAQYRIKNCDDDDESTVNDVTIVK